MALASSKEFLDIRGNCRVQIHSENCTSHDNNNSRLFKHGDLYIEIAMVLRYVPKSAVIASYNI